MENEKYNWRNVYDLSISKIEEKLKIGKLFENGNKIKFELTNIDNIFVYLTELNPDGKLTDKKIKIFKDSFVGLIYNKHFGETNFRHKEIYADMRKYEIGLLYKK